MREKNDVRGVLGVLEVCVRGNFAGTESARLYSEVRWDLIYSVSLTNHPQSFWGTKNLIECAWVFHIGTKHFILRPFSLYQGG
jgi:hypothetical protein